MLFLDPLPYPTLAVSEFLTMTLRLMRARVIITRRWGAVQLRHLKLWGKVMIRCLHAPLAEPIPWIPWTKRLC